MAVPQEFIDIIRSVVTGDRITENEAKFNTYKQHPNELVETLVLVIKMNDKLLSQAACTLLRPLVNGDNEKSLWKLLSSKTKNMLKDELFSNIIIGGQATDPQIYHKVVDLVSVFGPYLISENQWVDFIPLLLKYTKSENVLLREASYTLFGAMIHLIEPLIAPHFQLFVLVLDKGLADESLSVRISALKTISKFMGIGEADATPLGKLIPSMLKIVVDAITANNEQAAKESISVLISICDFRPTLIREYTTELTNTFFSILNSPEEKVSFDVVSLAHEFLIVLAERRPSAWKKNPNNLDMFVKFNLGWMSRIDWDLDLEEWNSTNLNDELEDNEYFSAARDGLERLSVALGSGVMSIIMKYIPKLIASSNWAERFASLACLVVIFEGLKSQFAKDLLSLFKLILPLVSDPDPRVRSELFVCIGQCAEDFSEEIKQFHANLLPIIAKNGFCDPNARVQSNAALALTTFLEGCEKNLLLPYVKDLFTSLLPLLQSPKFYVAESSLSSFSGIVESIGSEFVPYYNEFMPFLVSILLNNHSEESRELKGRAMEAISIIGVSVKKEIFSKDVNQILTFMATQPAFKNDDPQIDYFIRALTRICQSLGRDFLQYLDFAMKPLLAIINTDVEVQLDENEEPIINEESGTILDNKALALSLLEFYTDTMEELMFPYIQPLLASSLSLLKYQPSEDVRSTAASVIPELFKVAIKHSNVNQSPDRGFDANNMALFDNLLRRLCDSTLLEISPPILGQKLKSIGKLMSSLGEGKRLMNQDQIKLVLETYNTAYELTNTIYNGFMEEEDEEDEDQNMEEINLILDTYNALAIMGGHLVLHNKENAIPLIKEKLVGSVLEVVKSDEQDESIQDSMVCLISDICENGAPEYYSEILEHLIRMIQTSQESGLRQSSASTIGGAAKIAPERLQPHLLNAVKVLNEMITSIHGDAEEEDQIAKEHAINALGHIAQYCGNQLGAFHGEAVDFWLKQLPLAHDEDEIQKSVDTLVALCINYPSITFGNEMIRFNQIVGIISRSVGQISKFESLGKLQTFFKQQSQQIPQQYHSMVSQFVNQQFQQS